MSNDNIKEVRFGDADALKAGVELMKRNLSTYREHVAVMAKIRKASYDAHIEQGFTPQQALELCKVLI